MASMLEAFIFGILFFCFFKDVVDDPNTHTNDSAANVVEEPLVTQRPAINELVHETVFSKVPKFNAMTYIL
jgi:hypothetical protein